MLAISADTMALYFVGGVLGLLLCYGIALAVRAWWLSPIIEALGGIERAVRAQTAAADKAGRPGGNERPLA